MKSREHDRIKWRNDRKSSGEKSGKVKIRREKRERRYGDGRLSKKEGESKRRERRNDVKQFLCLRADWHTCDEGTCLWTNQKTLSDSFLLSVSPPADGEACCKHSIATRPQIARAELVLCSPAAVGPAATKAWHAVNPRVSVLRVQGCFSREGAECGTRLSAQAAHRAASTLQCTVCGRCARHGSCGRTACENEKLFSVKFLNLASFACRTIRRRLRHTHRAQPRDGKSSTRRKARTWHGGHGKRKKFV